MPRLGAHMSIAGGLPRAVERARATGVRHPADLHEVIGSVEGAAVA